MLKLKITQHATGQLQQIFDHSQKHWGNLKAKAYLLGLQKTMLLLAHSPNIAMKYINPPPSMADTIYYFPSQSHILYFLFNNQQIILISVLHKHYLAHNDPMLNNLNLR